MFINCVYFFRRGFHQHWYFLSAGNIVYSIQQYSKNNTAQYISYILTVFSTLLDTVLWSAHPLLNNTKLYHWDTWGGLWLTFMARNWPVGFILNMAVLRHCGWRMKILSNSRKRNCMENYSSNQLRWEKIAGWMQSKQAFPASKKWCLILTPSRNYKRKKIFFHHAWKHLISTAVIVYVSLKVPFICSTFSSPCRLLHCPFL